MQYLPYENADTHSNSYFGRYVSYEYIRSFITFCKNTNKAAKREFIALADEIKYIRNSKYLADFVVSPVNFSSLTKIGALEKFEELYD